MALKTIAAAEANRRFSAILRDVTHGEHVLVLAHGKPVARIVPVDDLSRERRSARTSLVTRLRSQALAGARDWTRDELYD